MSYLAGPLTREQIARLTPVDVDTTPTGGGPAPESGAAAATHAPDESPVMPPVADGVRVAYMHPAASWAGVVGASATGRRLVPALVARADAVFDERRADLRHEMSWDLVVAPLREHFDAAGAVTVDHDERDLTDRRPDGAVYVLGDADLGNGNWWRSSRAALRDHLHRSATVELLHNAELGLWSRPGETTEEFATRCRAAADAAADAEADELRQTLQARAGRVRDAIARATDRVREIEADVDNRWRDEVISGLGDLLGGLLGGRRSTRGVLGDLRRASGRRQGSERAAERLETARNRLADAVDDLEELEAELARSLNHILDSWEQKAEAVTTEVVGLERDDIDVAEPVLVWIPTD